MKRSRFSKDQIINMLKEQEAGGKMTCPRRTIMGQSKGRRGEAEPHLDTIARAINRHIAREHIRAWEREWRKQAANDNEGRSANGGQNASVGRFEPRMLEETELKSPGTVETLMVFICA